MNIRLVCPRRDVAEIEEGLRKLGMYECMDQPVREYSGGMRRRTAVLRALCADWDILFLDEPLKGLDDEMKAVTAGYIRTQAAGKTVVCVTHDREDIELLGAGQVIQMNYRK